MTGGQDTQQGPVITHKKTVDTTTTKQTPDFKTDPHLAAPGGHRETRREIDNSPGAIKESIEKQLAEIKARGLGVDTSEYEKTLADLNAYLKTAKGSALTKASFTKTALYNQSVDAIAITQSKLLTALTAQMPAADQAQIKAWLVKQGFADGKFPGADFKRKDGETDKDFNARMHAVADKLVGMRHGPSANRYKDGLLEKFHNTFLVEADRTGHLVPKLRKDPLVPGSCGKQMVTENAFLIDAIFALKTTTVPGTTTTTVKTGVKAKPMGDMPTDTSVVAPTSAPTGAARVQEYNTGDLARNKDRPLSILPLLLGVFARSPLGKCVEEICWPNNTSTATPFVK